MALALMLDLLVMTLMVGAQFPVLGPGLILALGLLAACLYRSLARANGRQSFGQAVLHLLTVNREAGPADFGQAARRTLGELALLPLSLLRGQPVLDRLDTWSATYEVRVD